MVERKIGDTVYIEENFQDRTYLHIGKITKLTKTGRFNVIFGNEEKQFLQNGNVVGVIHSYFSRNYNIITKEHYDLIYPAVVEGKTRSILANHSKQIVDNHRKINKSTLIEKLERMLVLANELKDANNE